MNSVITAVNILQRINLSTDEPPFVPSAQYQAVLDRATALGYAQPPEEQQIKQDALISGLFADGDLSEMDYAFVLLNQGSENFARINWANPTGPYALTNVGGVQWFSNQGSRSPVGSGGGYSTAFNPGTAGFVGKFLRNNNSFGVYVWDNFKTSVGAMGTHLVNTSGQGWQVGPRFETSGGADNVLKGQNNNGTFSQVGTGMSSSIGLTSVRRNNSGNYDILRNGVVIGTVTAASQVIVDLVSYICGVSTYPFGQGPAQVFSIPYEGLESFVFAGNSNISHLRVYNRFATYAANPYGLSTSGLPSPLEVDILAGQSNAAGRGLISSLSVSLRNPLSSEVAIYTDTNNKFELCQAGINNDADDTDVISPGFHGPEISYLKSFADVSRYRGLIKVTKGGTWLANKATANLTWSPSNNNPGNLYDNLVATILAAKATHSLIIKSLIWYQGEYDGLTTNQNDAINYQTNLTNFISSLRTDIGEPNLKVVLVKVHSNITEGGDDFHYTPEVRTADNNVAAADPTRVFTVDSDPYNPTLVHVASAGLLSLGVDIYNITKDF